MQVDDFRQKLKKLIEVIDKRSLSGIVISTQTNFKWLTSGRNNPILKNSDVALASLVITRDGHFLLATSSDVQRIMEEELLSFDFEPVLYDWYRETMLDGLKRLGLEKGSVGYDTTIPGMHSVEEELRKLRCTLTDLEVERYRNNCREYTQLMTSFCTTIESGEREMEIEDSFIHACLQSGFVPTVVMVGSDRRVSKYRHPVATLKTVDNYVLLATVAEKDGLSISLTRAVHIGKTPDWLDERQSAVNYIEASYYAHAEGGVSLKDLLECGKKAYSEVGYPDEWKIHTQGGIIAYAPRECILTEGSDYVLKDNNALSFNPTIEGVKAEDVCILQNNRIDQLSVDLNWPHEEIYVNGKKYVTSKILEL